MDADDSCPIGNQKEAFEVTPPPRPGPVYRKPSNEADSARYPLRGSDVRYEEPSEPVGDSDWEASR